MKKYRLTKITVKTREIISITNQLKDSSCPLCHQPLSALIPAAESSAAQTSTDKRPAELPSAETSGEQNQTYKGDL